MEHGPSVFSRCPRPWYISCHYATSPSQQLREQKDLLSVTNAARRGVLASILLSAVSGVTAVQAASVDERLIDVFRTAMTAPNLEVQALTTLISPVCWL